VRCREVCPFAKGNLIAVFDADFRPAPDFLLRLVPHFAHAEIGIVQARWAHLNREQNFLTRVQSYLLDTYFTVEQAGRQHAGYFSNFCGTAGIWRKQCIADAGGWDGNVLSEDLDLSYRAQLKGWKLVYDPSVAVPAELPSSMHAFKIQQARWTKGIVQTLRKNGGLVAKASLPFSKKMHAGFHLLSSFIFPCLFINSLLALPLLLLRHAYPEFIGLTNVAAIGGINLIVLTAIFYRGVKSTGGDEHFTLYYPLFLVIYMALSVQNTVSVLQGLFGFRSAFVRTPKFANNKASTTAYGSQKRDLSSYLELAMLFYFVGGIGVSIYLADFFFLLLFLMMSCGLAIVVGHSFVTRLRWPFTVSGMRRRLLFLFPYE
jgi:cellulose synthase/poly-beta-1,6-N-acetylglucosamine synthase-like glycosyltransferase